MTDHKLKNPARRGFIRTTAAGAGVVALGALGEKALPGAMLNAAPRANHKRVIVINMLGGNDGLNTLYPSSGAAYTRYLDRRPAIGFQQGQGLALTGGPNVNNYEIHPALQNLQALWNQGQVAFINKVGYPQANLSHFVSQDIWSHAARTAIPSLSGMASGWIARFANLYAPTNMGVASIGVGRRLDFAGAQVNPFLVASVASFNYRTDTNYSNNHRLRRETVERILALQPQEGTSGKIATASLAAYNAAAQVQGAVADYTAYAGANAIQYPQRPGSTALTVMGARMRDIAIMIHGGFETRLFYTGYGGFDTHSNQAARHDNLLSDLDAALGVFQSDMTLQGVWDDIAIVVISEFGRRNFENGSVGTDHGHGNLVIVTGGNVKGGMYGDDITQPELEMNWLPYTTDFRDVYRSLIGDHLGEDPTPIFPESQPISTTLNLV
jgi:uncharacterized protein (DUF1501 family)